MSVFLFLLLSGVVLMGAYVGAVFWGLAFSVHLASILNGLSCRWSSLRQQLSLSALLALLLAMGLYAPAASFWDRHFPLVRIQNDLGDFRAGDVVWYRRGVHPRPGDWIYYDQERVTFPLRTNMVYAITGPMLAKVIALSGQVVTWQNELRVDGIHFDAETRNEPHPWIEEKSVPPTSVAIIPIDRHGHHEIPPSCQAEMLIVPEGRILGVLVWRSFPPTRWKIY